MGGRPRRWRTYQTTEQWELLCDVELLQEYAARADANIDGICKFGPAQIRRFDYQIRRSANEQRKREARGDG